MSKTFDMSSAITIVLWGVFFCGCKPTALAFFMWCSAVVVDRCCQKPCWCSGRMELFVICEGRFFRVFAMHDTSAIVLYDLSIDSSLFGKGIGIIFAFSRL